LNTIRPGSPILLFGENWQDRILSNGRGTSYGIESFFRKNTGKLTGWLSLTLSKTNRKFEDINQGKTFPFRFDRNVDIALVMSYAISKSLTISMNWIYTTGEAATFPKVIYPSHLSNGEVFSIGSGIKDFFEVPIKSENTDINSVIVYGSYNSNRFPDYHRLDISLEKRWQFMSIDHSLNISIYNLYNRRNTFFVSHGYGNESLNPFEAQNIKGNLSSQSLFPFFPSLSYKIKF